MLLSGEVLVAPKLLTFQFDGPADLKAVAGDIEDTLEAHGACVVEPWSDDYTTFKLVASLFGDIQFHIRSNEEGIVGEGASQNESWKTHAEEYYGGISDEEFPPHTDGSYLDGANVMGKSLMRIGPPKMVILQCVRSAEEGGANIVVDSREVLERLLLTDPATAKVLLTPGCISYCRDDQIALDMPIYRRRSASRFGVRFRMDSKAYAPEWSVGPLRKVHEHYHLNPAFGTTLALRPGQIVVFDNLRVLHGREAFRFEGTPTQTRKLRRAWIADECAPRLANLVGATPGHRGLAQYVQYRVAPARATVDTPVRVPGGFTLSDEPLAVARSLLAEIAGAPVRC
jgi:alpha-ketoglutarate-dependent taurine dioxygenase